LSSFILNKLSENNLEEMLNTYINIIMSYRLCLSLKQTTFLKELEQRRVTLHTNILKELGCNTPETRSINCSNCEHKNSCIKHDLTEHIEKTLDSNL